MTFYATSITLRRLGLAIAALLCAMTITSCSSIFQAGKPDFDLTGRILDFDTKLPIEGAYVIAEYKAGECLAFVGCANNCVKTAGMYTGKNGEYRFPIDKLDGRSPSQTYAIKADHFLRDFDISDVYTQRTQTKEVYSNRNIYLKKQDPAMPDDQHGFREGCSRTPESSEAVEAAIIFMEKVLQEHQKYFNNPILIDSYKSWIASTQKAGADATRKKQVTKESTK